MAQFTAEPSDSEYYWSVLESEGLLVKDSKRLACGTLRSRLSVS